MKVLFVASEVAPYSKTGGLADVAGALPAALADLGHDVTVVTPLYASVPRAEVTPLNLGFTLRFPFGPVSTTLHEARLGERHRVVFLEQGAYFDRPGLYQEGNVDYPDNARRFAFLSVGALTAAQVLEWVPDVVHANDWQTGLCPLALDRGFQATSLRHAVSVFTVHNLGYQGVYPKAIMDELGLPWDLFTPDGVEFYDGVSFLKAGLTSAQALTTVSPRYAQEIQTHEGGCGLEGLLWSRRESLRGILNGVDYREWNPADDGHLRVGFDTGSVLNKVVAKRQLIRHFKLPVMTEFQPMFGFIGRLTEQKGVDLLLEALPELLSRKLTVVLLGAGERRFEDAFGALARRFPNSLAVHIGFDAALAHLVEAGSDFFLMPSRYEPCGLNQLYSLRYGALPIVRATGGLDDTVVDLSLPSATGIKFSDLSARALSSAIERALTLYAEPARLLEVRLRGMRQRFTWDAAARQYEAMYQRLGAQEAPVAA